MPTLEEKIEELQEEQQKALKELEAAQLKYTLSLNTQNGFSPRVINGACDKLFIIGSPLQFICKV